MALTVNLTSTQKSFLLGDTFTLTATVNAGEGVEIPSTLTYTWTKDGLPIDGSEKTLTITNATAENGGDYKVSVNDTSNEDPAVDSVPVEVSFDELIVTISKKSQYVKSGGSITLKATATYKSGSAPSEFYHLTYSWEKQGQKIDGGTTETLQLQNFNDDSNGEYTLKVHGQNEKSTVTTKPVKLIALSLAIDTNTPTEKTFVLDKTLTLPFSASPQLNVDTSNMPKLTIKNSWYIQRKDQDQILLGTGEGAAQQNFVILADGSLSREHVSDEEHEATFWCVAEAHQALNGIENKVTDIEGAHCKVSIVPSIHTMHRYVHPIPWRNTSFMYLGWWVFDEIVGLNEKDIDWRDPETYATCKYAKDIETVAGAEEKYGDCICMESRNGFLYDASQLHVLDRETFEKMCRIRTCAPEF